MTTEDLLVLAGFLTAIGTIAVAVLAIWGDRVRDALAGPRITLRLRDERGSLTTRGTHQRVIYWHLELINHRRWSPIRNVRLLVTSIEKMRPNGTFFPEHLPVPVQLTWAFPQFHELSPTVVDRDFSDLGYLDEGKDRFALSPYFVPNNFTGFFSKGEAMRVSISAAADNFSSIDPLVREISWNGQWDDDMEEMRKHLTIAQMQSLR